MNSAPVVTAAAREYRASQPSRSLHPPQPGSADVLALRAGLLHELLAETPRLAMRAQLLLEDGDAPAALEVIGCLILITREIARTGREMRDALEATT